MGYRSRSRNTGGGLFLAVILCLPCVIWCGVRIYHGIDYGRKIEGHLKRAADANTVVLAEKELTKALTEIETRKWTEGSTHVIYSTPSADVGFWYENIKASQLELQNLDPETTSQLEQTNVLMKLRETILDEGGDSISVTAPSGISVFPNNAAFFWTGWLTLVSAVIGVIVGFVALER